MAETLRLFTIGFTRKSAEVFFNTLRSAGVRRLVDIRLRNSSQMAGFTKRDDLDFFVRTILRAEYTHLPLLAPSVEVLEAYMEDRDWPRYERDFQALLRTRQVGAALSPADFQAACLMCSEPTADQCHRRLVAEHLRDVWQDAGIKVEIRHL
jgi:uncharacterized protein (DUF488 family)